MKHFFILLYFKKYYLYIQNIGKEKGKKGKEIYNDILSKFVGIN